MVLLNKMSFSFVYWSYIATPMHAAFTAAKFCHTSSIHIYTPQFQPARSLVWPVLEPLTVITSLYARLFRFLLLFLPIPQLTLEIPFISL